jgi:Tfp pilus assembly protein PilO
MDKDNKSNLTKIIIIIVALLIGGLLIGFLAYPLYGETQNINQEIKTKRNEEQALNQKLNDLKELEKNYEEAKEESKIASAALPTDKDWPELLVEFETMAGANNLQFTEATPGEKTKTSSQTGSKSTSSPATTTSEAKPGSMYKEVPVVIGLRGNFLGLKGYLKTIEKNLRIMDIGSINIEGKEDQTTHERYLDISLATKAYFQIK